MLPTKTPLVWTIRDRCRVCYTCVRECPAKAIRVAGRKAEVIPERCIACGHCVRVCSQAAKDYASDIETVTRLLAERSRGGSGPVVACVAPSFPAEFHDLSPGVLVGLLRKMGFDLVCEVSFGADLVAMAYRRLLTQEDNRHYIASTCPALVGFVERYHPNLVGQLAPIVSPMLALARAIRRRHGEQLKTVFIGPCIAKKGEAMTTEVGNEIDAVVTFVELRRLLAERDLEPDGVRPSDFDPPHGAFGALFPIHRGLLQAAAISEDLANSDVIAADRDEFVEALNAVENGDLSVRLLEALCCGGCVMGPGVSGSAPLFRRRDRVSRYVRQRMLTLDGPAWDREMAAFGDLDLSRTFAPHDQRVRAPSSDELAPIMARMGKQSPADELNCGACGYSTCMEHAVAIWKGLAESEMCLPYTIDELRRTCGELTRSNEQLASMQEVLAQSEKLASMGQLAAGIAHEVNNPLGTVVMLSHILFDEAKDKQTREDLNLIVSEADRCKKIVAGLLQFARKNKVEARSVDLLKLARRAVRGVPPVEGIQVKVEAATADVTAEVDGDQIMQVLTNLISNALAAMPHGGALTIRVGSEADRVWLAVQDTGVGIPKENRKKIFEPFFTTKPPGQGTGLGLAVSYGIVKMHHGDIRIESNVDPAAGPTGTCFTVSLPRRLHRPADVPALVPAEGQSAAGAIPCKP